MWRCILILLLFHAGPLPVTSQVMTMDDLLGTAKNDAIALRYQSIRDMAGDLKMHDPIVKEIALRIGFNGNILGDTIYGYLRNEDDLRLQVSFNDFSIRRQQKEVKSARWQSLTAEQMAISHSALADRYEALSDYGYVLPELEALKKLDSLLREEHEILKAMISTGILEVKVSRILDVEEDRNRVLLDISQTEEKLNQARVVIEQYMGSFASINLSDLATPEDIRASYLQMKATGYVAHPEQQKLSAEIQLDSAMYRYAASQNRQILDYVSLGYQRPLYLERPNKFNTFNNFAFRLGLLIPVTPNNRFRKADAMLDLQESLAEADLEKREHQSLWQQEITTVEGLFKEYDLASDRIENSLISQMLSNPVLLANITAVEIVELEIARQKLIIHQRQLVMDIASSYVELLKMSGRLAMSPETNFLDRYPD
jgi:hypothetical protein